MASLEVKANQATADSKVKIQRGGGAPRQRQRAIHLAASIADAVRISTELAQSSGRRIYVAGGLFVAVEYATVMRGEPVEELRFF